MMCSLSVQSLIETIKVIVIIILLGGIWFYHRTCVGLADINGMCSVKMSKSSKQEWINIEKSCKTEWIHLPSTTAINTDTISNKTEKKREKKNTKKIWKRWKNCNSSNKILASFYRAKNFCLLDFDGDAEKFCCYIFLVPH